MTGSRRSPERLPRTVGQLRLLTGDRASAEDIAQEAFIRAAARWRQLARYDQPEAWVPSTAFRLAIDQLRRAKRQRRVLARLGTRREPEAEPETHDRAVIEALLRLPLPLREVLVLLHCLDLPVETVTAQTGVSPGTVKSRLSRGRDRLAALLDPDLSPPAPDLVPEPQAQHQQTARHEREAAGGGTWEHVPGRVPPRGRPGRRPPGRPARATSLRPAPATPRHVPRSPARPLATASCSCRQRRSAGIPTTMRRRIASAGVPRARASARCSHRSEASSARRAFGDRSGGAVLGASPPRPTGHHPSPPYRRRRPATVAYDPARRSCRRLPAAPPELGATTAGACRRSCWRRRGPGRGRARSPRYSRRPTRPAPRRRGHPGAPPTCWPARRCGRDPPVGLALRGTARPAAALSGALSRSSTRPTVSICLPTTPRRPAASSRWSAL